MAGVSTVHFECTQTDTTTHAGIFSVVPKDSEPSKKRILKPDHRRYGINKKSHEVRQRSVGYTV